MTMSSSLGVFVLFACLTASANAQSTTRVGQPEKPVRLELSVGYDPGNDIDYHRDPAQVTTGTVALRWSPGASWIGMRGSVLGIRRHSRFVTHYSTTHVSEREDRVLALTVSTDASLRIWRDLTIAPSVGVGFSPAAHGEQTTRSLAASDTAPPVMDYRLTEQGVIWTAGIALRYRHLIIEKQLIGLLGANYAVPAAREYYPLSVGFRF